MHRHNLFIDLLSFGLNNDLFKYKITIQQQFYENINNTMCKHFSANAHLSIEPVPVCMVTLNVDHWSKLGDLYC